MDPEKWSKTFMPLFSIVLLVEAVDLYWFGMGLFSGLGWTSGVTDQMLGKLARAGVFGNPGSPLTTYYIRLTVLGLCIMIFGSGAGRQVDMKWPQLVTVSVLSLAMYMIPSPDISPVTDAVYVLLTGTGFVATCVCVIRVSQKLKGFDDPTFDVDETFQQGIRRPVQNDHSVSFRIRYRFGGRWRKAWVSFPNVYRAFLIFGGPGSGKTYVFINEIIWQLMQKGFTMFVYDFKFPVGLATYTYNCFLRSRDVFVKKYGAEPEFVPINMKDVRYSKRCNPLDKRYIERISDASNKSMILSKNVVDEKEKGFFGENREKVWTACIWFLRNEEDGQFCTFPHFIELVTNTDAEDLMHLLMTSDDCRPIVRDILHASDKGASDQSEGVFSSASAPLAKLRSQDIYYVFGGNNVDLRINRKDKPTILCVGNAPERKEIYSAGISLITSEMYVQVNQDHRAPCAIVQDEYPTMKPLGFGEVIATGRSRKLAAVAAAQDMSQLERDLGKENAVADSSIIGNKVFGMTTGPSRKDISDMFGQHKVRQQSITSGGSNETTSTSWHFEKRLPEDRLAGLSNGFFAGIAADGRNEERLKDKYFCAEMLINETQRPNEKDGRWEEIPPASWDYFRQDAVKAEVEADPRKHSVRTLYMDLMDEEREKKAADRHYSMYSEITGMKEAERRYDALTHDQQKALLDRTVERCRQEEVNRILDENMAEIHKDILYIFHKHGIGVNEDGNGTAAPKKSAGPQLNGAERSKPLPPFSFRDDDDERFD